MVMRFGKWNVRNLYMAGSLMTAADTGTKTGVDLFLLVAFTVHVSYKKATFLLCKTLIGLEQLSEFINICICGKISLP
jgi:hypothetical protein